MIKNRYPLICFILVLLGSQFCLSQIDKNSKISVVGEAEGILESTSFSIYFTISNQAENQDAALKLNSEAVDKISKELLDSGIEKNSIDIINIDSRVDSIDKDKSLITIITQMSLNDIENFTLKDKIKAILASHNVKDKKIEFDTKESLVGEKYDELLEKAKADGEKKATENLTGTQLKLNKLLDSDVDFKIADEKSENGQAHMKIFIKLNYDLQ